MVILAFIFYVCAAGSLLPSVRAGLAELRGGPPALGGGASGVPFREGTKSCSLLFCSPSAKYSSNARLGDNPPWRCLRPVFDDRAVDWLPRLVAGDVNGGGEAMLAGTRKFPEGGAEADAFGLGSRGCSEPSSLVSNTTSPGPSTSSPSPTGSRCNAPYPSTAPSAPSPPHPLVGISSTSRTTSNSLL